MSWVMLVALGGLVFGTLPASAADGQTTMNPMPDGEIAAEKPDARDPAPGDVSQQPTDGARASSQDGSDETVELAASHLLIVFPVAGRNSYTDSWGAPRSGGRTHKGADIFAAKGTPVVAVAPGEVIGAAVSDGTAGVYVKIRHANGAVTAYLHLNNDTPDTDDGAVVGIADGIAEGAVVDAGTIIGYVGDSGNAEGTPPHLHFEYRPDGVNAVNPFPLLQVVQGVVAQAGTAAEALPYTGYESTPMPGAGFLLLAAGMLILLISWRLPRDYIKRSRVSSITCSAQWSGIPPPREVQNVDHLQRLAERLRSRAPDSV